MVKDDKQLMEELKKQYITNTAIEIQIIGLRLPSRMRESHLGNVT